MCVCVCTLYTLLDCLRRDAQGGGLRICFRGRDKLWFFVFRKSNVVSADRRGQEGFFVFCGRITAGLFLFVDEL